MNILATLAVLAVIAAPALAHADDMNTAKGGGPADKAYAASMDKMMKDMGAQPSGDPDKDFVTMMMPHHHGAIDMAKVELRYGKDPVLRNMAADIVRAQGKEIGEMKAWRAKNVR